MERTYTTGFGGNATFATAAIGQGIFVSILMLETLLVVFLAPMATAGAISLEREKQTLEMLAATPITSVAIVVGKLLSALIYVWLLIAASIPLTAVVFVFGGVAPDDLLHGYLVLIVTALGLGAFGLLCSSLVKRTQAASAITIFGVLALSIGSLFVILFWQALAPAPIEGRGTGPIKGPPPAPLIFLNPFLAQADVAPTDALCGTSSRPALLLPLQGDLPARPERGHLRQRLRPEPSGPDRHRRWRPTSRAIDRAPVDLGPDQIKKLQILAAGGGGKVVPPIAGGPDISMGGSANDLVVNGGPVPFEVVDAGIWEKYVIGWFLLSIAFLLLSVQFVSPTRRWRLRRGARRSEGSA